MLTDLNPANSMQVSIIQSDKHNRKYPDLRQGVNLPHLRSLGWMGGNQVPTNIGESVADPSKSNEG